MKTARFVLKIVAASLALAAAVCFIIGYWDKVIDCVTAIADRVNRAKAKQSPEYEDYADWEE